jgi:hypothetical protein
VTEPFQSTDFEKVIRVLFDAHVEFILIGGLAATAHGSARLTRDVDVVYSRSNANIRRLVGALEHLEPYLRGAPKGLPFSWDEETIRMGLNFTLSTSLGAVDLLGEVTGGGGYDALRPHAVTLEVFGKKCLVLDLPWLIRVKRAAGRPKDIEAIAELEALLELRDSPGP